MLTLVQSIVENTKEMDEGRVIMHIDSLTIYNNVTNSKLKTSTLASDGGAIISQIRRITGETKVDIDCIHINTKMLPDEARNNEGIQSLLQCDKESKRVQFLCEKKRIERRKYQ